MKYKAQNIDIDIKANYYGKESGDGRQIYVDFKAANVCGEHQWIYVGITPADARAVSNMLAVYVDWAENYGDKEHEPHQIS